MNNKITSIMDLLKKKIIKVKVTETDKEAEKKPFENIGNSKVGKLDMVIAFDTTGSMASYIGAVRKEVSELIPRLFKNNEDLRLGIVAFGDYCDMIDAQNFGKAYQCIMPTNNENDLIKFVNESSDTSGGDGDEFYELVIHKIVEETPWREDAVKSILLISDADPHPLGYSYMDYVVDNRIDWREEAKKAAAKMIKIDTVTITGAPWYKELSAMTNGVSSPFSSGYKTARLVEAAAYSRGSMKSRKLYDELAAECMDEEMAGVFGAYRSTRDDID